MFLSLLQFPLQKYIFFLIQTNNHAKIPMQFTIVVNWQVFGLYQNFYSYLFIIYNKV